MKSIRQSICWTAVFLVVLPNLNHYILSTFIYQSWEKIKLWTKIFRLKKCLRRDIFKNLERNKHGHKISRHWRNVSYISHAFIITANWHLKLEYCDRAPCCSVPHHGWPDIRVVPPRSDPPGGGANTAAPARAHLQHHCRLHQRIFNRLMIYFEKHWLIKK